MEIINLKPGDTVKVFDYGNDLFDEIVTIYINDVYSNELIYITRSSEKLYFSGQGYFEPLNN